jgi:hypothetical protein
MLCQAAVLLPYDVRCNPGAVSVPVSAKAGVQHHIVALGYGKSIVIAQCLRLASNEVEQTVMSGTHCGTVLNIGLWPEVCHRVVALVE